MNPRDPNVALVESVAHALGPLCSRVVFVGGCAVGLLITDKARPTVRATQDVDIVAEIGSRAAYYSLANELRGAGFVEDNSASVICRWRLGQLQVDVMPTDMDVLGFSNRWLLPAIRTADLVPLPSGKVINLVTPPLLIATKLEAFYDRGEGNYGASHDMEDIVNLVDGRPEITQEVRDSDSELRAYLAEEVDGLLGEPRFTEVLPWHLGPNDIEQARVEIVIERFRRIAGL